MAEEKNKKHFFKDMRKELKKVIWPTKKQTVKNTLVVIGIVLLVAVIVIVLDEVFINANNFVVDKVTGGQISETKTMSKNLKELSKLHEQGKIDDSTFQTLYIQAAYGLMDSATLKETIKQIKDGTYQTGETQDGTDTTTNSAQTEASQASQQ